MRAIGTGRLTGAIATLIALLLPSPAAAARALHVIPFPGTPDASPVSRIIFSSLHRSDLSSVLVTGSQSGTHQGRLISLPDDAGTAFIPDQPFSAGEQVSVVAALRSAAAGSASGDPGSTVLRFSFTIAVPVSSGAPNQPTAASATVGSGLASAAGAATADPWPAVSGSRATADPWPAVSGSRATADPWLAVSGSRATADRELASPGSAATADPLVASPATTHIPTQHFHSAPGLHPPVITATRDPDESSGDIFLTPTPSAVAGAMIVDSQGRLLWFDQVGYVANLEVQRYRGRPVLTWTQSTPSASGKTVPKEVIMNRSYRVVKDLYAGDGYQADLHDFQLTPQGTAFIDAYVPVKANLQSVGGPADGSVVDSVIQELDVRTGQLLWEWHVLGHVPLSASYAKPVRSLTDDYFHLNSIQPLPNGNILISARNTWAVYEIDKQTGRVVWSLGGRSPSFKMGAGTNFEWQHDARLSGDTLTLFDDAALPQEERQSSAKALHLNFSSMTASLVARYRHTPPLLSPVTGSAQALPNHNMFVGWGRQPYFSEYTATGQQIFSASFPPGVASYRALRFPWHAQPSTRPAVATARRNNGTTLVWASWNGATEVASWRVLGGIRPGELTVLATASRSGFETRIVIHDQPRLISVQALNAQGKILRTSGPHSTAKQA